MQMFTAAIAHIAQMPEIDLYDYLADYAIEPWCNEAAKQPDVMRAAVVRDLLTVGADVFAHRVSGEE